MNALVTGASAGIGRALARELALGGAKVAVAARRTAPLEQLAEEIERAGGTRPVILRADLSQPGEAARLAERALEALGEIDLLVNNAGSNLRGRQDAVADSPAARAMLELNYWSPLALTAQLAPQMVARGRGAIVNVASISALTPMPENGHYSSSKAALSLATETLRMELHGTGVHVLSVLPGPVQTDMLEQVKAELPAGRKMLERTPRGTPEALAKKIVRAVEKRQPRVVYPAALGFIRRFPNFSLWAAHKLAPQFATES